MSLYDVGDLIFDSLETEGRLVADGSLVNKDAYPELVEALGEMPFPEGYATLPHIPNNPKIPGLPVLIQATNKD